MEKLVLVKILLFVLSTISSDALQLGRCPFVRPQADFDLEESLGTWYEYALYPIPVERLGTCTTVELEQLSNNTFSTTRTLTGILTGIQYGFTETSILVLPGVYQVGDISSTGIPNDSIVYILGTDYTNYTVTFSCRQILGFGIFHQQYAFIRTRERNPSTEVINAAFDVLRSNGLSTRNLMIVNQLRCL